MTALKLREGWEMDCNELGFTLFKRTGAFSVLYVIIDPEGCVLAYRFREFGLSSGREVDTIEEAHAYLVENGSESPWEEV
jgi:hypothetical protein